MARAGAGRGDKRARAALQNAAGVEAVTEDAVEPEIRRQQLPARVHASGVDVGTCLAVLRVVSHAAVLAEGRAPGGGAAFQHVEHGQRAA